MFPAGDVLGLETDKHFLLFMVVPEVLHEDSYQPIVHWRPLSRILFPYLLPSIVPRANPTDMRPHILDSK